MRKVLFIGGCNAEHVSLRLRDVSSLRKIYRIPTACIGPNSFDPGMFRNYEDHQGDWQLEELWGRVRYESSRRYVPQLQDSRFDLIVIDLWRDSYIRLVQMEEAYISLGYEIINKPDVYQAVVERYPVIEVGTPGYEAAFQDGLDYLGMLLRTYQNAARVVILDCPPVPLSMREGSLVTLEEQFEYPDWVERYAIYRTRIDAYLDCLPQAEVVAFGQGGYSAPDAPWGEAVIHYAAPIYAALADRI